jgi:predicted nuclease with RNAse H fold
MNRVFVGIDIQEKRGCCFAALQNDGIVVASGWFHDPAKEVVGLVNSLRDTYIVSVGIDAPRQPLPSPRRWYWNRRASTWTERTVQRGYGRHCEIVVSAHGLANPQWTPIEEEAPSWMVIGFRMFAALESIIPSSVHEVFPTASYSLLHDDTDVRITIDFSSCMHGPKDMLDAFVAAATVREFVDKRGCVVGGEDDLGTIVLPRPLRNPIAGVLKWPKD